MAAAQITFVNSSYSSIAVSVISVCSVVSLDLDLAYLEFADLQDFAAFEFDGRFKIREFCAVDGDAAAFDELLGLVGRLGEAHGLDQIEQADFSFDQRRRRHGFNFGV